MTPHLSQPCSLPRSGAEGEEAETAPPHCKKWPTHFINRLWIARILESAHASPSALTAARDRNYVTSGLQYSM